MKFNDVGALKTALEKYGKNVAAFLVEPIQGEGKLIAILLFSWNHGSQ